MALYFYTAIKEFTKNHNRHKTQRSPAVFCKNRITNAAKSGTSNISTECLKNILTNWLMMPYARYHQNQ